MMKKALFIVSIFVCVTIEAQTIDLVAGTGMLGYSGDGGNAKLAQLCTPLGVAVDKSGNVYISDYGCWMIRKVSPLGIITTISGANMVASPDGDGGPANLGRFHRPTGMAIDTAGNLYICEHGRSRIRKISKSGIITTVVGTGSQGFSGDGFLAVNAQLNNPLDVAVDISGNLYIADQGNYRVRKVSTNGIISTVAGNGINGFAGDGGMATAAELSNVYGVEIDNNGNILIADYSNYKIRKVNSAGIITTIAGTGTMGFSGDGGLATAAQIGQPTSVCADSKGNVYFSDYTNHRIRKINSSGIITTITGNGNATNTGDGGLATNATINFPAYIQVDSTGVVYFGLNSSKVRAICPSGCPFNVGINSDNNSEANDIIIYPNPVNEKFNLIGLKENMLLEIFDSSGKLILSEKSVGEIHECDLSKFQGTLFILKASSSEGNMIVKKLIRN